VFLELMLHFLGGMPQQNLPWLLFATPVWLAIAVGLHATAANGPSIEVEPCSNGSD
jgi:hypothetical protein